MIVKTGSHKSGEICQRKRSFFDCMNSSRLFPDIQQMSFELWRQICKILFLSVQINFFRRKFFPEKNSVREFSSELGWSFDRVLRRKKTFNGKLSAEFSERDSTLSEGLFVFFVFFLAYIYEKCVPVSRWKILRKKIEEKRKSTNCQKCVFSV